MTRSSFECSATCYRQDKILATYTKGWNSFLPPSPFPSPSLLPGMLPPHGRHAPGEGARTPTKRGSCANERPGLISAAGPLPFGGIDPLARTAGCRRDRSAQGLGHGRAGLHRLQPVCRSFSFCFPFSLCLPNSSPRQGSTKAIPYSVTFLGAVRLVIESAAARFAACGTYRDGHTGKPELLLKE